MGKPDNNQRGLAGEYYVAFILSRLGYDVSLTIGRAKILDMTAIGARVKTINIQVKSTYLGYDWLVANKFDPSVNSMIALVRLGKDTKQRPELYFLPATRANELITHKYAKHSPRISRADVQKKFRDHDFGLIEQLIGI